MILFLHSAFATNSSLTILIRSLLDLDNTYSDRFILDTFTISVPGYNTEDEDFVVKDIFGMISDFAQNNAQAQSLISSKAILGTQNPALIALRDTKLNIVGVDGGGSLGLLYTAQNPESCSTLTLIDSTYNYTGIWNKLRRLRINRILDLTIAKLQNRINKVKDWNSKIFLTLVHDNSSKKGIKGFIDFMFDFDFSKHFSGLTLLQQHNFNKIQILSVISRKQSLPTKSSQKKMSKLLHPDNNLARAKHTMILVDQSKKNHFDYKVVEFQQKYILHLENLDLLTTILQNFYKQNII